MKTLFALSGNVCAFFDADRSVGCEEKLTDPAWSKVKARICHIRGCKPGSARFDSSMSSEERRAFDNLMLLCPNHHAVIDELEPERYTVELLTQMKTASTEAGQGAVGWATKAELEGYASTALALMRQRWRGADASPSVEAHRIRAGTAIEYAGQLVTVREAKPFARGGGVHLVFSEQIFDEHGTGVVGWDLADEDLVTLWIEP